MSSAQIISEIRSLDLFNEKYIANMVDKYLPHIEVEATYIHRETYVIKTQSFRSLYDFLNYTGSMSPSDRRLVVRRNEITFDFYCDEQFLYQISDFAAISYIVRNLNQRNLI